MNPCSECKIKEATIADRDITISTLRREVADARREADVAEARRATSESYLKAFYEWNPYRSILSSAGSLLGAGLGAICPFPLLTRKPEDSHTYKFDYGQNVFTVSGGYSVVVGRWPNGAGKNVYALANGCCYMEDGLKPDECIEYKLGQWVQNRDGYVGKVTGYNHGLVEVTDDKVILACDPHRLTKITAPSCEVGDWAEAINTPAMVRRVCERWWQHQTRDWMFKDNTGVQWRCDCFQVVAHDKEQA